VSAVNRRQISASSYLGSIPSSLPTAVPHCRREARQGADSLRGELQAAADESISSQRSHEDTTSYSHSLLLAAREQLTQLGLEREAAVAARQQEQQRRAEAEERAVQLEAAAAAAACAAPPPSKHGQLAGATAATATGQSATGMGEEAVAGGERASWMMRAGGSESEVSVWMAKVQAARLAEKRAIREEREAFRVKLVELEVYFMMRTGSVTEIPLRFCSFHLRLLS
jgi:hypothetical protein